jgi:purine-nucleoside/S-methyl-5'-thioadenosine phosphorylase / adenosine deaminase
LAEAGVPHLFSTRYFPGVRPWRDPAGPFEPSALAMFEACGLGAREDEPIAFLRQVHGARVIAAERGGLAGQADIVTSNRPGLPLAIFTADCLPIVAYDPANHRLAMAHAGWRGTVQGVARLAIASLAEAGAKPHELVAAIGPSIGPCCYEVDRPVIQALAAAFPDAWRSWVTATGPEKWMFDLWKANEDQLKAAGLDARRVDNLRLCTACRADLFYSYRRGRGQGRLVSIAAIPDAHTRTC